MKVLFALTCLCLPLVASATTSQSPPPPVEIAAQKKPSFSAIIPAYKATYTLFHKSDPVGNAIRQLSYLADDKIKYHYETDISWLIFSDKRTETAIVKVDNNQVTPLHYDYHREGTGRDKSYQWQYDLTNKTATDLKNDKQINLDFTDGLLDKLSYHLQNRLDLINNPKQKRFIYPVISTRGSIKNYEYQYDGEEELILPYGLVKTIRLKREIIEKKRITYAWFAPELNYLLVKLYQVKAGAEQFEAQLSAVEQ
jgi:outer membrane lipoprotein-sorting protein